METGSSGRSQPPNGSAGLSFTARIAGWSARHRWPVLAASATVIFLAVVAIIAIGTDLRDDDEGVGESRRGIPHDVVLVGSPEGLAPLAEVWGRIGAGVVTGCRSCATTYTE